MEDLSNILTFGEQSKQELKDFQKTDLYKNSYKPIVRYLYLNIGRKIPAKEISDKFNIKDRLIRDIIRFGRRVGHPIISSTSGYSIETDYDNMVEYLKGLEAHVFDMLTTISRMKKLCRKRQQISMRLRV
jgi:hypothetical protein